MPATNGRINVEPDQSALLDGHAAGARAAVAGMSAPGAEPPEGMRPEHFALFSNALTRQHRILGHLGDLHGAGADAARALGQTDEGNGQSVSTTRQPQYGI